MRISRILTNNFGQFYRMNNEHELPKQQTISICIPLAHILFSNAGFGSELPNEAKFVLTNKNPKKKGWTRIEFVGRLEFSVRPFFSFQCWKTGDKSALSFPLHDRPVFFLHALGVLPFSEEEGFSNGLVYRLWLKPVV